MIQRSEVAAASPAPRAKIAGLLGLAVVFAAGLMLSACNTTAGAGEDVSAAGKDVTKAAVAVQKKM